MSDEQTVDHLDELEAAIAQPGDGIQLLLGGYGPLTRDSATQSEKDLIRAETISLPIAAAILILVFGSLVAAGLPLLVAGLAIPTTLGAVYFVAQATELSIFVQNVSTMLGLALAIDYSLFMVSRFREELAKGRPVGEAVEVTVGTAGKAVAFSGFAVAVGLSGLLVFAAPALRSFGIGGALTVLASLLYALTFLPATLGMLGPRVATLSVVGLVDRIRSALGRPSSAAADAAARSRWERLAHWVMRRPVLVLVPTLAVLVIAGVPFFRLVQGIPDAFVLPAGLGSREAAVTLQTDFQPGTTTPIVVLADVAGPPTSEAAVRALADLGSRLGQVDGVDTVESPFDGLRDPSTGAELTVDQLVALYALPREQWPPALGALYDRYVHDATVRFDAISPETPASPSGTAVIPRVRALAAAAPIERIQVGGFAAVGEDFLVSQANRIPYAIGITLFAMAAILFLLFGSVVLPVKAIVMTLLSLSASFGALVWIFQEGNFQDVLHFQSPGFTIAGNPIIMFCVLFGLSMDYEVLLLSRMQEAYRRHGDNTEAVAEGLSRTARVITGRGADHGLRVLVVRARGHGDDQEHRRRDGDRGADRRDDRADAPGPGDDAAARRLELVGPGSAGPVRLPARVQPRRGRGGRARGRAATRRRPRRVRGRAQASPRAAHARAVSSKGPSGRRLRHRSRRRARSSSSIDATSWPAGPTP